MKNIITFTLFLLSVIGYSQTDYVNKMIVKDTATFNGAITAGNITAAKVTLSDTLKNNGVITAGIITTNAASTQLLIGDSVTIGDKTLTNRQRLNVDGAIKLGTTATGATGAIRMNSGTFEWWTGSAWLSGISTSYGTIGFADSAATLTMTQNAYAQITNAWGTLFITGINDNLTFAGDSIQIETTGDYEINWDLSYSGANADEYHIELFVNNVGQSGKGETIRDMTSTSKGVSSGNTMLTITANHWVCLRISNVNNNNDATIYAGNINIKKL